MLKLGQKEDVNMNKKDKFFLIILLVVLINLSLSTVKASTLIVIEDFPAWSSWQDAASADKEDYSSQRVTYTYSTFNRDICTDISVDGDTGMDISYCGDVNSNPYIFTSAITSVPGDAILHARTAVKWFSSTHATMTWEYDYSE